MIKQMQIFALTYKNFRFVNFVVRYLRLARNYKLYECETGNQLGEWFLIQKIVLFCESLSPIFFFI